MVRVHELTAVRNQAFAQEGGGLRVSGDTVIDFSTFVANRSAAGGAAVDARSGEAVVAGSLFTDHATVAVEGTLAADHGAGFADPLGTWGSAVVVTDDIFPTEAPFRAVVGCAEPIPTFGGELVDVAAPASRDPDGSRGDLGATGGPDADPTLWDDTDGDTVPAMWDCDPEDGAVSPLAIEVQDGLDNDCDGIDTPAPTVEPPIRPPGIARSAMRWGSPRWGAGAPRPRRRAGSRRWSSRSVP